MAIGKKTGGRTKGVRNKATAKRERIIAETGVTPLDYMLSRLRDEQADPAERFEAAKAAAPYVHPRLAAMDMKHGVSDSLEALIAASMGPK